VSVCDSRNAVVKIRMKGNGTEMIKKAAVILLALGMVARVSAHESGHDRDSLARFEGGIGGIPVQNVSRSAGAACSSPAATASVKTPIKASSLL
jgi:hypothetical protein